MRTCLLPVMLLSACHCPRPGVAPGDHYEVVGPLRHAVVRGEVGEARDLATQLEGGAQLARLGSVGIEAELDLHAAVGFLLSAGDPAEAGEGLAAVGAACGACHRIVGADVPVVALPDGLVAPADHGRLADALWWSLVRGDPVIAEPALVVLAAEPITRDPSDRAARARAVQEAAAGGDVEGALSVLLGSCAGCHGG